MSRHYQPSNAGVEWATPARIYRPLLDAIGGFDLDSASGAEDTPIAEHTFTVDDNGLAKDWFGDVWCNPPYSKTENPKWADKIGYEATRKSVDTITALVPAATDTQWFQQNYAKADYLTFIEGRISFNGSDDPATFPNVICSFGEFSEEYIGALESLGVVMRPKPKADTQSRGWF